MSFDITYYSFSPKRADAEWEKQGEDKINDLVRIFKGSSLADPDSVEDITAELKNIDLELGGIRNLDFPGAVIVEDAKILIYFISAIHRVFNLALESETTTKENLIHIFKNLSLEKVTEAANVCVSEFGFEFDDSKQLITSVLTEMKPLVKDLIETEDALLYVDYHGSIDGEPKEVDELLGQRAAHLFENHSSKFDVVA